MTPNQAASHILDLDVNKLKIGLTHIWTNNIKMSSGMFWAILHLGIIERLI